MQGVVGERVLGLVHVIGTQQGAGPHAHVVRRKRTPELGRQTLGLDELMERVQVVAVEKNLLRGIDRKTAIFLANYCSSVYPASELASELAG